MLDSLFLGLVLLEAKRAWEDSTVIIYPCQAEDWDQSLRFRISEGTNLQLILSVNRFVNLFLALALLRSIKA